MTCARQEIRIVYLLTIAALALALNACGAGSTGTAGSAPATPQPTDIHPTAVPAPSGASAPEATAAPGGPITSHGGPVTDQVSLIDALRKAGATITPGEQVEQPFLSIKGTRLDMNGADVQVFEYPDEAAAQADAASVADILAGRGTTMIDWIAPPHFYHAGRVLVLYVGEDEGITEVLTNTVGPQMTGG